MTPRTPDPSVTLDEAWAEAEAALPEGWTLEVGLWSAEPNRRATMLPYEATAAPYVHDPWESGCIGRGDTASAAVRELTAALVSLRDSKP